MFFDDIDYAIRDSDSAAATVNPRRSTSCSRSRQCDGATPRITAKALMPGANATELQRHVGGAESMTAAAERFRRAGPMHPAS